MNTEPFLRLALLYPGDRTARDHADPAASRFTALFDAFARAGVAAEPAVYDDDFRDEVWQQLLGVKGVLVWHNPIEGGRGRELLDARLRDLATRGVFVSTHPDTILKLGTKDILMAVRDLPIGSDVHRIESLGQLAADLPERLASGARVLKQQRGQSGIGVWRLEQRGTGLFALQHAQRGCVQKTVNVAGVLSRLAPYFDNGGHMIDQAWQPRMVEGMTRAYMVGDRVAGFGHQAVVALHPGDKAGNAGKAGEAMTPGPRLYSDASDARFVDLRRHLESTWVRMLCERVGVEAAALPMLWDADFLPGERAVGEDERYVLCEINVSSVSPFPDSCIAPLVAATSLALASTASGISDLPYPPHQDTM